MSKITRRRFTQILGGASALAAGSIAANKAAADGHSNLLDPESPAAKGLQFVLKSENENKCSGCLQYTADDSGAKGNCSIFTAPANVVPAEAWCVAYTPKP